MPFVVLVILAAGTGVLFQPGGWYETLRKPSWTPPNWAFGPVWSVLYIMIAVAGWLVWSADRGGIAMYAWGGQLLFNGLWSYLFFGVRRMDLALVDAVLMLLCIGLFIVSAAEASLLASLLFIPYMVWVTIASALNLSIWLMNPRPSSAS